MANETKITIDCSEPVETINHKLQNLQTSTKTDFQVSPTCSNT